MTSLCQKITSSASKDLEGPDDLKLTLPSIRELLSRSDSSELLEHLSRGAYVTHSPPIVLPSTVGVNLPLASGGVENDRWEEGKQFKSRYVREFRGSFARSGSSAKDENDDSLLTLDFMASFSDENESNPDTSVVPRERRKSFIFNDYALSKEGSPERERGTFKLHRLTDVPRPP